MRLFMIPLMVALAAFMNGGFVLSIDQGPPTLEQTMTTLNLPNETSKSPTAPSSTISIIQSDNTTTASTTSSGTTASSTNTSASTTNTTAPSTNATTPSTNTTPPPTNTTTPSTNATTPSTSTTIPSTNTTTPSTNTTTPSINATTPSTNATTPSTNTTTPSTNTTTPSTNATTPSTDATTPSTNTTTPSTNTTTPSTNTTTLSTNTTTPSTDITTPNGTAPTSNTTKSSTSSPHSSDIRISETNILIWNASATISSWFIELSGTVNENLDGLTLAVQDATKAVDTSLLELPLKGTLESNRYFLVNHDSGHDGSPGLNLTAFEEQLADVKAVLLLLYYGDAKAKPLSRDFVTDFLLYAVTPGLTMDSAIQEVFQAGESQLIVNLGSFETEKVPSLSRCNIGGNDGALVTAATPGDDNQCQTDVLRLLEMKLTMTVGKCDSSHLPHTAKLQASLTNRLITSVNTQRQGGLTPIMLSDVGVSVRCRDKMTQEYPARFTVHAVFEEQMVAIVDGYRNFIMYTQTLPLEGKVYDVTNCTASCFKHPPPRSNNDDDNNIKITVAAVFSCIGVFLVVLVVVIVYMKRKRRGILQFRMARLDEDDDDLIAGDMDDFVGNQGATFSSFR